MGNNPVNTIDPDGLFANRLRDVNGGWLYGNDAYDFSTWRRSHSHFVRTVGGELEYIIRADFVGLSWGSGIDGGGAGSNGYKIACVNIADWALEGILEMRVQRLVNRFKESHPELSYLVDDAIRNGRFNDGLFDIERNTC